METEARAIAKALRMQARMIIKMAKEMEEGKIDNAVYDYLINKRVDAIDTILEKLNELNKNID